MEDKFVFSDAQTITNTTSTGEISDNIWDLEYNDADVLISTDQMIKGNVVVILTTVTITSGITEGLIVGVRVDDAVGLATARNGTTAGFRDIAMAHVLKEELVNGLVINVPFFCDRTARSRYLGVWYKAASTALVGSIILDAVSHNESRSYQVAGLQKRPA
jgi:hypothetical protein